MVARLPTRLETQRKYVGGLLNVGIEDQIRRAKRTCVNVCVFEENMGEGQIKRRPFRIMHGQTGSQPNTVAVRQLPQTLRSRCRTVVLLDRRSLKAGAGIC